LAWLSGVEGDDYYEGEYAAKIADLEKIDVDVCLVTKIAVTLLRL
jgi:hypothetical protein